jgi:hypothetical protein
MLSEALRRPFGEVDVLDQASFVRHRSPRRESAPRLTREQALQALTDPSARLAPGLGQVHAARRDRRGGRGRGHDAWAAARAGGEIASRANGVSAMPDMDLLLARARSATSSRIC